MLTSAQPQARNPNGTPAASHPAFKPHPMQGWSPDFIPKLTGDAVEMGVIDRVLTTREPVVVGLRQDGGVAPFLFDGRSTHRAFESYVAQVLVPLSARPATM